MQNIILSKRPTLLHWIIFWAVLSIVFNMTGTDWGIVASVISAIILVVGTLLTFGKRVYHKWVLLRNPLNIIYEYSAPISPNDHKIGLSMLKKTRLTINFLCLSFEGQEEKPIIKGVYNYTSGRILTDNPLPVHSKVEDSWILQDQPALRQSDISLAVGFIAEKPFDGILRIDLKCDEVDRIIYNIHVKIMEKEEHRSGKGHKGSLSLKKDIEYETRNSNNH